MSDPQGSGPNPPTQQPEELPELERPTGAGGTAPRRAPAPLADDDGGGSGTPPPTQQQ